MNRSNGALAVTPIPCLKDNYAYLLVCRATGAAAVVDPSEAKPVLREIKQQGVHLVAILNTHHHWDHVGGNRELVEHDESLQVYGHVSDAQRIPSLNRPLNHSDHFTFGRVQGRVWHNPGHTLGAISYLVDDMVFTGDTLFAAGCGRVFEGTPEQMFSSLNEVLGALPDSSLLFFGHEYTANNLRFAQRVEPYNSAIQSRLQHAIAQPRTTPSTMALERQTNPFLRCHCEGVRVYAEQNGVQRSEPDSAVFGLLRATKDQF